jgi:hypothetical protein
MICNCDLQIESRHQDISLVLSAFRQLQWVCNVQIFKFVKPVDGLDEVCKYHDGAWDGAWDEKLFNSHDWNKPFLSDVNLLTSSIDYMKRDPFTGLKVAAFSGVVGYGIGVGIGKYFSNDATQVIGNPVGTINNNNSAAQLIDIGTSNAVSGAVPIDPGFACSEYVNCLSIKFPESLK